MVAELSSNLDPAGSEGQNNLDPAVSDGLNNLDPYADMGPPLATSNTQVKKMPMGLISLHKFTVVKVRF